MHQEFLMGNEAMAMGALAAGVNLVAGYPGTPSSEIIETIAAHRTDNTYVEWSVNEKAGMEVAAGAAYAGARTMVTMKQVGLNVASDPLMSLAYQGVEGGMVVLVADDPGPISSQTEQDTRTFAAYSKLPLFDPSSVQEAYDMIQEAFAFSEEYKTPVLFRPTTRVCHGYADILIKNPEEYEAHDPEGFVKDPDRWVIFPRTSFANHKKVEERNERLSTVFSEYPRNIINREKGAFEGSRKAVATNGISYAYTMEAFTCESSPRIFKVTTPFPFPEEKALEFLDGCDEVLCIEELDPVIERSLIYVCGKYGLSVKIRGKLTGDIAPAGENTVESVAAALGRFYDMPLSEEDVFDISDAPALPIRPPVLCAGCPHRASFYAVKRAMKGKKTVYCGDIGCYTLGNALPLDMTDTCLCMGAGITMAQGIGRADPGTVCFSFTGDSTFFASGITGIVNAFYNQADMTAIILDNSTTAMTGHQPHPGTGRTAMGEIVEKVDIEAILRGIGLTVVETADPFDLDDAIECVKRVSAEPGVKAIIFRSPCIAITKPKGCVSVDENICLHCRQCIKEIGCPAIGMEDGKIVIDDSLCTGCGLCCQVCPAGAMKKGGEDNA